MTTYGICVAYFAFGFFLGVVGVAVDAERMDDWVETISWMAAWTIFWPLVSIVAILTLVLERFFGIHGDEKDEDE